MENNSNDFRLDVVETSPCVLSLTATLTGEATKQITRKIRNEYLKEAKLPGFRAGKIPQNLFEMKFGKAIRESAEDEARRTVIRRTMSEVQKPICGYPSLDGTPEAFKSGEEFTMKMTAECFPEITLPEYSELKAEAFPEAVSDDDVTAKIDGWRAQQGRVEKVDRPATAGDMLKVTYKSDAAEDIGGDANYIKHLLNAENTWIILREPEMLPGASKALDGISAGESRDFAATFPDDHYAEALRGKTFNYHCEVSEVHGSILPELDDELAKRAGATDVANLKDIVRKNLEAENEFKVKNKAVEELIGQILAKTEFPLPPSMLKSTAENILKRLKDTMKDASDEERQAKADEDADKAVRTQLVLNAIAKKENLQPSQEMLYSALNYAAMREGTTAETLLNRMKDNDGLNSLYASLTVRLAEDFLFSHADVKKPEAPAAEAPAQA